MEKQIVQVEADSITFERLPKAGREGWKIKLFFDAHQETDFTLILDKMKRLDDWFKSNLVSVSA